MRYVEGIASEVGLKKPGTSSLLKWDMIEQESKSQVAAICPLWRPSGKARVYKCTIAPWHRSLRQAAKQTKPTAARPVAPTQQVNKQPGHTQTDVAGHNRIRTGNRD